MASEYKPTWFAAGVSMALLGCWLVFWQPGPFAESPAFALGPLLLALGSVLAALQFSLRPRGVVEVRTAPAEVEAWVMLLYVGTLATYLLLHMQAFTQSWWGPGARAASPVLLQIAVFYTVVSALLRARRGKAVLEDERDRQIKQHAIAGARGALVAGVVVLMVTLGLSTTGRMQWATPPAVAYLLALALLLGWWVQAVVTVVLYWRDRP